MFFATFFKIIERVLPGNPLDGRESELARLNPGKFYVENVRSLLSVSTQSAQAICETAVRQGVFTRGTEIRCPDGSVAAIVKPEDEFPETVHCWHQIGSDFEEETVPTDSLEKVTFYTLSDQASNLH